MPYNAMETKVPSIKHQIKYQPTISNKLFDFNIAISNLRHDAFIHLPIR